MTCNIEKIESVSYSNVLFLIWNVLDKNRTCDLLLRRELLYPTELQGRKIMSSIIALFHKNKKARKKNRNRQHNFCFYFIILISHAVIVVHLTQPIQS